MSNITQKLTSNIEHLVNPGETFKMVVTGYSMLPMLGYGDDTIILRRTADDDDIMGRIAMFRTSDGHIVVHRVIDIEDGIVTLRGDGNIVQCERCARKDILGVVERVERQSGREVSCMSRWWRICEQMWLIQPMIVRRYILAIIRRMANLKRRIKG